MRDIYIHIDEIVLDGVEASNPDVFRAELTDTLTGLALNHQGNYPTGTASTLHGSSITAPISGEAVAHSMWASMIPSGGGDARETA